MITLVKDLNLLRYSLCPQKMNENTFWFIYFTLLRNRIGDVLEDDDPNKIENDWKEYKYHEKNEKYKKNVEAVREI